MAHLLMLLAGLALAAVNLWQRRGASPAARRWALAHRDFGRRDVLVMWPLLAVALLLGAALGAADPRRTCSTATRRYAVDPTHSA